MENIMQENSERSKSRKGKVRDFIRAEAAEIAAANALDNHLPDDEFSLEDAPMSVSQVISAAKSNAEERQVDELLSSVPTNQDYYLKLSKETNPNEFELKLRIDNFSTWSDLEWETTKLVREHTRRNASKWGSGHYRIIVWRDGGVRGQKFKPIDLYVDAMEEATPKVATLSGEPSISQVADMIRVMKEANPSLTPAEIQNNINSSFTRGLEIASSKANVEATSNSQMMSAMMTMMGSIITASMTKQQPTSDPSEMLSKGMELALSKSNNETSSNSTMLAAVMQGMNSMMLAIATPKNVEDPIATFSKMLTLTQSLNPVRPERSLMDTISELKTLGLISTPEDKDPLKKLEEMRNYLSIVRELGGDAGGSNKTSMFEKVIETVTPHAMGLLVKVTDTVNNIIEYKKIQQLSLQNQSSQSSQTTIHRLPQVAQSTINPSKHTPVDMNIRTTNVSEHVVSEQAELFSKEELDEHEDTHEPIDVATIPNNLQSDTSNQEGEQDMLFRVNNLMKELVKIVNNYSSTLPETHRYEYVAKEIAALFGGNVILEDLADGKLTKETIVDTIITYSMGKFGEEKTRQKLLAYIDKFSEWVKTQYAETTQDPNMYTATCIKCGEQYDYPTKEDFSDTDICENIIDGILCNGELKGI